MAFHDLFVFCNCQRANVMPKTKPSLTTMPTWQTYPPYIVEPVDDEDGGEDGDDDDDGGGGVIITPCNLWFFNVCCALRLL